MAKHSTPTAPLDQIAPHLQAIRNAIPKAGERLAASATKCVASFEKGLAFMQDKAARAEATFAQQRASIQQVARQASQDLVKAQTFTSVGEHRLTGEAYEKELVAKASRRIVENLSATHRTSANLIATGAVESMKRYQQELKRSRLDADGLKRPEGDLKDHLAFERLRLELRHWSVQRCEQHLRDLLDVHATDSDEVTEFVALARERISTFLEVPSAQRAWEGKSRRMSETQADDACCRRALALIVAIEAASRPDWLRVHEAEIQPLLLAAFRTIFGVDGRQLSRSEFQRRFLSGYAVNDPLEVQEAWCVRFLDPRNPLVQRPGFQLLDGA
jgi:hypothetical protein